MTDSREDIDNAGGVTITLGNGRLLSLDKDNNLILTECSPPASKGSFMNLGYCDRSKLDVIISACERLKPFVRNE